MAAVGNFFHNPVQKIDIAATNAYAVARSQAVNFALTGEPDAGKPPRAILGGLYITLDTIAGAASLTVRLTRDSLGDIPVIGDSTATISTGITTAAKGAVTFRLDIPYMHNSDQLYCFWKTDAGTCQVRQIDFVWTE